MERSQQPLAIVNSKAIYDSDIDEMIAQMGSRGQAYQSAEGRALILEQLIAQRLFLADAMHNLYEREPAFKEELQRIKEQLLTQYAISKAIDSITVTDIEARKFFDENRDQFSAQPTLSASHILVDSEEKANDILAQIKAGSISFEDAARQYSSCPSAPQGGALGEFTRGQMVPEFEEAAFSMEVGELRGPVKTQFGYHIIRLDDKKEGEPVSFEQARDQIKAHLIEQKRQQAYQSRVNQLKILYPVERPGQGAKKSPFTLL